MKGYFGRRGLAQCVLLLIAAAAIMALLGCGEEPAKPAKAPAEQPKVEATGPSKFATLDGLKVHYEEIGQGQGPAVVFIHGWACDRTFWRAQVPALKDGYRLLLLDLPGHGLSDKPQIEYTQDLFARAVEAVVSAAGADKVVLVGHSMGLPVARQFVRLFPGRAVAVVNVDGAILRFPAEDEEVKEFQAEFSELVARLSGPESKETMQSFIEPMFEPETPPALREDITKKMLATPRHVAASAMKGFGDPSVWKEDPVTLPSLAVYASSPYLEEDHQEYLRQLFPDLTYQEMDNTGHFLMLERPEEFNRLLLEFLAKLKG